MKRSRNAVIGGGAVVLCVFASAGQPVYTDVTGPSGTEDISYGRGSAMYDLDQDGLLDIITGNAAGPNKVFRQLPDHTFIVMNEPWGFGSHEDMTWGTIVSDFDNDGDPDVLFVNGSAGGFDQVDPCRLFRNDLKELGTFTEVGAKAGDLAVASENFGGTSFDFDNDGDLDIFLSSKYPEQPSRLLRNEGGLQFSDVGLAAGIVHSSSFRHCSIGDIDGDGWLDIAVGALDGPNRLYRNKGDGTFVDIAPQLGVDSPNQNFGLALEDFNNDGHTDVYIPKWQQTPSGPSELFLNMGDGTLQDVSVASGMTGQTDMGHNTVDINLDGYTDIFVGTGAPRFADHDLLLLVTPDENTGLRVTDYSGESGIHALGGSRCHGIVFGDYDRDGDLDIYLNNGGPGRYPATIENNHLLRNDGPPVPWTAITLEGTESNRDGIGAKCVATTSDGREIHRMHRSGNGFCNTNPAEVWFGPGEENTITRIDITWPSGLRQSVADPVMGTITRVVERSCDPDVNEDGKLTPADFTAWINAYNTNDAKCDQNRDGVCSPTDFTAWVAKYNAGC
ncbi:MAG: CRTAC1 family protein [Phycisphaera sp.]|nr:MAG: CRTAC1 family protein [Phycisphaera sp.]